MIFIGEYMGHLNPNIYILDNQNSVTILMVNDLKVENLKRETGHESTSKHKILFYQ